MDDKAPVKLPPIDTAITSQFWDEARRKDYLEPEKYLMLAVLKDALLEYRNNLALQNSRFKNARAWFFDRKSNWLFSFESICDALNVDPSFVRKGLLAWTRALG